MSKKSRLRWFGHVQCKNNTDRIKCLTFEVEGIRGDTQRRPGGIMLRMTWKVWACPERMHSLGINGEELRGQLANSGSTEKMAIKLEFVCVPYAVGWAKEGHLHCKN